MKLKFVKLIVLVLTASALQAQQIEWQMVGNCPGQQNDFLFIPCTSCTFTHWAFSGNPTVYGSTNQSGITLSWPAGGTYQVTAHFSHPYASAYVSMNVTINSVTSYPVTLTGPTSISPGQSATFTASASASGNYRFYINNVSKQYGSSTSYTTNALINGDVVKVQFSPSIACALSTQASKTISVGATVTPAPSVPSISTNTCGAKTLTRGSPPSGITWYWQGTNSNGTDLSSTGTTYTAPVSGIYFIRARNNTTLVWSASTPVTVNVIDPPAPGNGTYAFCDFDQVSLTVTKTANNNLRWYSNTNQLLYTGSTYKPELYAGNYIFHVKELTSQGCESQSYSTVNVTFKGNCDELLNWSESTAYTIDVNGSPIPTASSKSYADGFGNVLQSQSKNYSANEVMATHTVRDHLGNASLSTLPAPINSDGFGYRHKFITNTSDKPYTAADFDAQTTSGASGELNNPKPVANSGQGTLGWYYSSNNTIEPLTPVSAYPYSRSYVPPGPDPTTSKSAGPGEQYKMGSGHEVSSLRQKITVNEIAHYYKIRPHLVQTPIQVNPNLLAHVNTATNTYFAAHEYVSIGSANSNIYVTCNQSTSTPGVWPIGGNITVAPGESYTFSVRGYRSNGSSAPVNLWVSTTTGTDILWPGALLPSGSANEGWVSCTFTVPAGITSIRVGVQWSTPVVGQQFVLSGVELRSQVPTIPMGYKYISTSPDGKKSATFVDFDGKTLASALITSTSGTAPNFTYTYDNWSYTYYNDIGQVVATVAPNGVVPASTNYPQFVTTYKYDHLGRLIETTSPDEGTSQYVYTLDGKIRFSQNQEQRNANPKRFSYTNYDYLGRLVESGEYTCRTDVAGTPYVFEPHSTLTPASNSVLQEAILESKGFTGISRKIDANRCGDFNYIEYDRPDANFITDTNHPVQKNLYFEVSKTENLFGKTWYSYDEFGQLAWTKQLVDGLGYKTIDYTYDYVGNVTQVAYQKGAPDAFYHHYYYDADQRLIEVRTSTNGTTQVSRAKYHYYLHGPLKRVELMDGSTKVQGIDYVYTIQGALKGINHADKTKDPGNDGDDIFGQTLAYHDNDYQGAGYTAGTQSFGTGYDNQFGGMIKGLGWHSPADNNSAKNAFAFTYDPMYQFKGADYGKLNGTSAYSFAKENNVHKEAISSYDKNGNINALQRTGKSANILGDYSYTYIPNTNKLDKIDHQGTTLIDYSYNAIGQMTQQVEDEKTLRVEYNAYGKTKIIRNGNNQFLTIYAYDDQGNLSRKISYENDVATRSTHYVYDAGGNVMAIYNKELPTGTPQLLEVPVYGAGRVAVYKPQVSTYFYEVSDHLGNVRGVIGRTETQTYTATLENNTQQQEQNDFNNYSHSYFDLMDHTDAGATYEYAQLLNGGNNLQIGLAKSFAVSPGDVIKAEVYAKYLNLTNNNTNLTGFGSALAEAFGVSSPVTGEGQALHNSLLALGAWIADGGKPESEDDNVPDAYLNIFIFDVNYNLVDLSYKKIESSALQVGTNKTPHNYLVREITINQPGYAYIFLSNENLKQVDVYFDDLKITHTHSPIVAGADFYPFGLAMDGREIKDEHYRWGYQGQYAEKDTLTGLNEFQLRMYDARFGRWLSPDPYGQFASPYLAMGNKPHMGTDPDGGWCCGTLAEAMGDVAVNALADAAAVTATKITTASIVSAATSAATGAMRGGGGTRIEFGDLSYPTGDLGLSNIDPYQPSATQERRWTSPTPDTNIPKPDTSPLTSFLAQEPGFAESLIPIWGSGREAASAFSAGNYWTGAAYTALAISDIFLVKSIATGLTRGAWKLGSHTWSATRSWYGKRYGLSPGTQVHHWAISQQTIKKYGWQSWANQPWNLKPMLNPQIHRSVHGWGSTPYGPLRKFIHGTPTWFKAGTVSGGGRVPGVFE